MNLTKTNSLLESVKRELQEAAKPVHLSEAEGASAVLLKMLRDANATVIPKLWDELEKVMQETGRESPMYKKLEAAMLQMDRGMRDMRMILSGQK